MRLTVRTLLAWRDHVLAEEDQRDLDQKVLSHDAAQKIEQRIERVLGNLDLPSPRVDATGLSASANSMAEFLDNALPEECLGLLNQIALSLTFSCVKQLSVTSCFRKCLGSKS